METLETKLLSSQDSLQLAVLATIPSEEVQLKGVLQLVHGMCEHKERYLPFMRFMSQNGWICVIHDHRGHGQSLRNPEDLGYFYEGGFQAMIEDVKVVSDWIRSSFPDQDLYLFGHSMGSMVVRSYLKNHDDLIRKLVVCGSPSYDPASSIGILLTRLIIQIKGGMYRPKLVQKMSFNSFNKNFKQEGSPNAWVCSDPDVVDAYDHDPLCAYQFTANGFFNLFSLMKYTYSKDGWKMNQPELPIHFISGEKDPCMGSRNRFGKAVNFMKEMGYKNVTSRLYEGMRHEILNEKEKVEVWNDILEFLEA